MLLAVCVHGGGGGGGEHGRESLTTFHQILFGW